MHNRNVQGASILLLSHTFSVGDLILKIFKNTKTRQSYSENSAKNLISVHGDRNRDKIIFFEVSYLKSTLVWSVFMFFSVHLITELQFKFRRIFSGVTLDRSLRRISSNRKTESRRDEVFNVSVILSVPLPIK